MKKRTHDGSVVAFRCACAVRGRHRYAGAMVLVDRQRQVVIRSTAVVSHNPAVFEIDVRDAWDVVERMVYRYKLQPGADFAATKELVLRMHRDEPKLVQVRDEETAAGVFRTMLADALGLNESERADIRCTVALSTVQEDVQHGEVPDGARLSGFARTIEGIREGGFFIRTRPVQSVRRGTQPYRLKTRCMVECELTDTREVVRYIIGLLYGSEKTAIQGRVIGLERKPNGYTHVTIAITPVIMSRWVLHKSQRIRTA